MGPLCRLTLLDLMVYIMLPSLLLVAAYIVWRYDIHGDDEMCYVTCD